MKPLLGPIGVLAAPRLVGDRWKQEDGGQDWTYLQQMLTDRLKVLFPRRRESTRADVRSTLRSGAPEILTSSIRLLSRHTDQPVELLPVFRDRCWNDLKFKGLRSPQPCARWHVHVWTTQQLLLDSVFPGVTLCLSSVGDFWRLRSWSGFGPETCCLNDLENDLQDSDSLRSPPPPPH